jgi:hypothetical protein
VLGHDAAVGAADAVGLREDQERFRVGVAVLPGPGHRREQLVGVDGAGDGVAAVDDEERRAAGAQALGLALVGVDLCPVAPVVQRLGGVGAVQADLLGEVEDLVDGPQFARLPEVDAEHRRPRLRATALRGCVGEAVTAALPIVV